MRILFIQKHTYPIASLAGTGKRVTEWPSGSAKFIHDLMVRALAEKGHEVYYLVKTFPGATLPDGVKIVSEFIDNVDIVHLQARDEVTPKVLSYYRAKGIPVLATNHVYRPNEKPPLKWVHVSRTMANLYGDEHYVYCGLDPADFIFSDKKQDYFLFLADISRHMEKGLDMALKVAREHNIKLVVAGSSHLQEHIDIVQSLCDEYQVAYVGDVKGRDKAELLSQAKALISPSRLPESFGLSLAEALFSGTPVICSDAGAYREIIPKEVGFVCNNELEFHSAIDAIDSISPRKCVEHAMNNFHYLDTTAKYLTIYDEML